MSVDSTVSGAINEALQRHGNLDVEMNGTNIVLNGGNNTKSSHLQKIEQIMQKHTTNSI